MKQRIAIAQALLHEPELLILDEATSGLDPRGMAEVRDVIKSLKGEGRTIFMSSHLLGEVQEVCDDVALLNHGELLIHGSVRDLSRGADTSTFQTTFLRSPTPQALEALGTVPGVAEVKAEGDSTVDVRISGGEEGQARVLEAMVSRGLKVLTYRPLGSSLEQLYLDRIRSRIAYDREFLRSSRHGRELRDSQVHPRPTPPGHPDSRRADHRTFPRAPAGPWLAVRFEPERVRVHVRNVHRSTGGPERRPLCGGRAGVGAREADRLLPLPESRSAGGPRPREDCREPDRFGRRHLAVLRRRGDCRTDRHEIPDVGRRSLVPVRALVHDRGRGGRVSRFRDVQEHGRGDGLDVLPVHPHFQHRRSPPSSREDRPLVHPDVGVRDHLERARGHASAAGTRRFGECRVHPGSRDLHHRFRRLRDRGRGPRDPLVPAAGARLMSGPEKFGGFFHFFGKGDFKGLVLHLLEERPMHGYEIIKAIEERYHGFYKPSAGAIYPALRALLRKGYLSVSGEERRKTYRITREGKAYLRSRRKEIEERFRAFESAVGPERAALFREFRATGKLLRTNMSEVTPKQANELRQLVIEMREKVMRILSK